MPLSEKEELEMLELEEQEALASQSQDKRGLMEKLTDVGGWAKDAKKHFIDQFFTGDPNKPVQSMTVSDNPLLADQVAPPLGKGLAKLGGLLRGGAEAFATSPNIVKVIEKLTPSSYLPGGMIGGRVGGYALPYVRSVQTAADAANLATRGAQKGAAWALDHTPQAVGTVANSVASHVPGAISLKDTASRVMDRASDSSTPSNGLLTGDKLAKLLEAHPELEKVLGLLEQGDGKNGS